MLVHFVQNCPNDVFSLKFNIDWDKICGVTEEGKKEVVPLWLLPLCWRIASLQRLEQLGRLWAPIGPVPNPLRMEAVLGGGFGWGSQAFEVLTLQGKTVLKMLFAVTFYVERACDDARHLEERVKAAINPDRLAALMAKSGLLAEVIHAAESSAWLPRLSGVNREIAEKMLMALIGAHVGEKRGDFYSVVKLWQWLTCSDELMTSLRYLDCATTEFRGRTPTYENFKQVEADDGTLEFNVYYEDLGVVRFRRPAVSPGNEPQPHGQFVLQSDYDNGKTDWRPVQYDHGEGTYV